MKNNISIAALVFLLLSAPIQVSGGPVAFGACMSTTAGPICAAAAAQS